MIYLDHAATTPVHLLVQTTIASALQDYGNPSSLYAIGRQQKQAILGAKKRIADYINAVPEEIIFTASGSEANNLAIQSILSTYHKEKGHLITSQIEHPSVRKTMQWAETLGFTVTYLPVNQEGMISLKDLEAAITKETRLVSIMMVNNEIGSQQPIKDIAALLKEYQIPLHTDAVQAFGQEGIDVDELGVDFLSVSGHKINAPKGIGFLYKRKTSKLLPLIHGGSQENGLRAGTENVPYILGLAKAVDIIEEFQDERIAKNKLLMELLFDSLHQEGIDFEVNGYSSTNSHHVVNIWLKHIPSSQVVIVCDLAGIAISAGSACSAGSLEPSPILTALYGSDSPRVSESIRISFGYQSQEEDILRLIQALKPLAEKLQR
ncbi:cysteine desulfurase family protein [Granulicatella seriolae]|uniref:cysteine desulfurase n=1 Tax=Granulicatella seriolae TaxID=2967226 RepID=A0ABT1WQ32_9LACT|nr:cysteine desulfurase family protein [Granulicatella seriolae]